MTKKLNDLEFTGERLVTQVTDESMIEHLHRYGLATLLAKGKSVLDIASGEGYGSNLLADAAESVTGVDISHEAVNHAADKYRKDNLRFIQGSAADIPCESGQFDLVVSFETIEHHDKHDEMMREIKRVLKKDGVLIISSPDKLNYTDMIKGLCKRDGVLLTSLPEKQDNIDIPKLDNPFHIKELYLEEFKSLTGKYFRNTAIYFQRLDYASYISSEKQASGFVEIWGDYSKLYFTDILKYPVFDLIIASDSELPVLCNSVFSAKNVYDVFVEKYIQKRDGLSWSEYYMKLAKDELNQTHDEKNKTHDEINQIQNMLNQKQDELSFAQSELKRITSSRIWRWGNKIANLLRFIAPRNSWRRNIIKAFFNFINK